MEVLTFEYDNQCFIDFRRMPCQKNIQKIILSIFHSYGKLRQHKALILSHKTLLKCHSMFMTTKKKSEKNDPNKHLFLFYEL